MVTSGFVVVWVAASVGTLPSIARSVLIRCPSKGSTSFRKITAEQTPTYTSTVKSGATVRGLVKGPYAWDWKLEIVLVTGVVLMRTLGTTPWLES